METRESVDGWMVTINYEKRKMCVVDWRGVKNVAKLAL